MMKLSFKDHVRKIDTVSVKIEMTRIRTLPAFEEISVFLTVGYTASVLVFLDKL